MRFTPYQIANVRRPDLSRSRHFNFWIPKPSNSKDCSPKSESEACRSCVMGLNRVWHRKEMPLVLFLYPCRCRHMSLFLSTNPRLDKFFPFKTRQSMTYSAGVITKSDRLRMWPPELQAFDSFISTELSQ